MRVIKSATPPPHIKKSFDHHWLEHNIFASPVTSGPTKRVHCFPLYTSLGKATVSFLQPTTSNHCSDGFIEQPMVLFLVQSTARSQLKFQHITNYPYTMKDLTFHFSTSAKYN